MFRGEWLPGRRTEEEKKRTEEELAATRRLQAEVERFQKALAAQAQRLRRKVEERG